MTKKQTYKPLSFRLKLILTFLYLTCIGYLFNAVSAIEDQDREMEYVFNYETYAASFFIFAGLMAWVIYNFHARKNITGVSFAVALLVIYGLSGEVIRSNLSIEPWSAFWSGLATTGISVIVAIFLLRSKEATSQLNRK